MSLSLSILQSCPVNDEKEPILFFTQELLLSKDVNNFNKNINAIFVPNISF